jgi:hypothetical protein
MMVLSWLRRRLRLWKNHDARIQNLAKPHFVSPQP